MPNYNVRRRSIIVETIPVTAADPASAVAAVQAAAVNPSVVDNGSNPSTVTVQKHPQTTTTRTSQKWKAAEAPAPAPAPGA